jgi:hypothetical protein
MTRTLCALALALALSACKIGGTTSCDFRVGDDPEDRCQERNGVQGGAAFAGTCDAVGGESAKGECPDPDQIVGGCKIGELSGEVIDWYYAPKTLEEVQAICEDDDGELVEI